MDWKDYLEPDTQKKSEVRKAKRSKISDLSKLSKESKDPEIIKLAKELQDDNWEVRKKAVKSLWNKKEEALPFLNVALEDDNMGVRVAADEAIRHIKEERKNDAKLNKQIKSLEGGHWIEKIRAIEALGKMGDIRTVEPLIKALKDADRNVIRKAVELLGEIGDRKAVEPLIEILGEGLRYLRGQAAEALGRIGDERAVEPLIEVLIDKNRSAMNETIIALGTIRKIQEMDVLIEALSYSKDGKEVKETLKDIKDKEISLLIEALAGSSNIKAVKTLIEIGEVAVPLLIEALKNYKVGIRELSSARMGNLNFGILVGSFTGAIRESAAEALGKIRDTRGVEPLIETLQDEHWAVRWRAVEALGEIGDEKSDKTT